MEIIKTNNITQVYEGREVLKNISLSIEKSEVFTIVGPTGSGKTTLIRILDLLEPPRSGEYLFDGIDMLNDNTRQLEARRRMAYVQQRPTIFTASVFDNVACGLRWRRMKPDLVRQKTDSGLELVGMEEYRERNARTLSGGETQRIAIARALVTEPEVLYLDEPTANMDPVSVTKIEEVLSHIIREQKITIIMTTHNMSQAQRMSSRLGVVIGGEMLQTGRWQEIYSTPGSREVASLIGIENMVDGEIVSARDELVTIKSGDRIMEVISELPVGEKVCVCIRPEDITLSVNRTSTSARNSFTGKIIYTSTLGALTRVTVDCGFQLMVLVTTRSAEELDLVKGREVYASFKATAVHVIRRQ